MLVLSVELENGERKTIDHRSVFLTFVLCVSNRSNVIYIDLKRREMQCRIAPHARRVRYRSIFLTLKS